MKNLLKLLCFGLMLSFVYEPASAQKDLKNKDLKAIKKANQEAKRRRKEGWDVAPGSIPMEKIFERAWELELEQNDYGDPKYLMATGSAVAGTKAAADQAALTAARNELAAALSARVSELIETKRANDQIDQATANTLDKTVSNSKTLIQAELSQVKTAYKIYKKVKDKSNQRENIAVETKIFYNQDEAMRLAQKVIRKELEKESDELGEQLDDILGIGKKKEKTETKKSDKETEEVKDDN
jgi:hypothetical protein